MTQAGLGSVGPNHPDRAEGAQVEDPENGRVRPKKAPNAFRTISEVAD